jgi:hypothetical protein
LNFLLTPAGVLTSRMIYLKANVFSAAGLLDVARDDTSHDYFKLTLPFTIHGS